LARAIGGDNMSAMSSRRAAPVILFVLLVVSGCAAYDPPVMGDHTAESYRTDLEACRKSASHAVYLQSAGEPGTWILSPVTNPPKVRARIRSCMTGKGYALEKAAEKAAD
jgi:hypothetical protein